MQSGTNATLLERLLELSKEERLEVIRSLPRGTAEALLYDWEGLWARLAQREPVLELPWLIWFLMGGRGSGKTRPAAEWVWKQAHEMPGSRGFVAARTLDDVRTTCMEGESGVLAVIPPGVRYKWKSTKCELWIYTGDKPTFIKGFTSEKPDQGRGKQHHWGWADEFASWLKMGDLWDHLMFGLRLPWPNRAARAVVTSTPLPIARVRDLVKRERQVIDTFDGRFLDVVISRMTTYENMENLSPAALALVRKYEGTRLGEQELMGRLLDDVEGALWRREWFLRPGFRIAAPADAELELVIVAIDPAITAHEKAKGDDEDSDYTGIIAGGRLREGDWLNAQGMRDSRTREHYCVLRDESMRSSPEQWATRAIDVFHELKADFLVAETNRGGDLVAAVLRNIWAEVPFVAVNASRGKRTRAEPVATLYEQGRSHHAGTFEHLEDQLCVWVPSLGESPDRLDANVWMHTAARELNRFTLG